MDEEIIDKRRRDLLARLVNEGYLPPANLTPMRRSDNDVEVGAPLASQFTAPTGHRFTRPMSRARLIDLTR